MRSHCPDHHTDNTASSRKCQNNHDYSQVDFLWIIPLLETLLPRCLLYNLEFIVVEGLIIIATWSTTRAVELASDGVCDVGQLLLLLLKVLGHSGGSVLLKPVASLLDSLENLICRLAVCQHLESGVKKLTVSLSSSSILPPRPSSSLTWFFRLKA